MNEILTRIQELEEEHSETVAEHGREDIIRGWHERQGNTAGLETSYARLKRLGQKHLQLRAKIAELWRQRSSC